MITVSYYIDGFPITFVRSIFTFMHRNVIRLLIPFLLIAANSSAQKTYPVLSVPGTGSYTQIKPDDRSVLPSGRFLTPAGKTILVTHDPFGMAVSPDAPTTVTLHHD